MSVTLDYSWIIDRANEDGEFKMAARFWNATVRLDTGEQPHILRVRDGRLVSLCKCDSAEAAGYDIRISAPESNRPGAGEAIGFCRNSIPSTHRILGKALTVKEKFV